MSDRDGVRGVDIGMAAGFLISAMVVMCGGAVSGWGDNADWAPGKHIFRVALVVAAIAIGFLWGTAVNKED